MFKIQVVTQMGVQFSANLFKNDAPIGGLVNDARGLFVNLRNKLTTKEMMALMLFIQTLNVDFEDMSIGVNYVSNI